MTNAKKVQRLHQAFSKAHYVDLMGGDARRRMVECGTNALSDGFETTEVAVLAGAIVKDDPVEVRTLFRNAADEVGAPLPDSSSQEIWLFRLCGGVKCGAMGVAVA